MAVLVTGVGYIGSRLVVELLERGQEVVAVDNLFSTDLGAIERMAQRPGFHFIQGDVGDRQVLEQALSRRPIDVVYALAAQSSGHPNAADPLYTETTNLLAPRQLLDLMVASGTRTIVFASSLRVYGNALPDSLGAQVPYGRLYDLSHLSKCYVEKLLEMYATLHGLRCLSLRLGIVHGLAPVMKIDYRFMTAPNKFCLQIVRGEPIQVNAAGRAATGYIHVGDAAAALVSAAERTDLSGYNVLDAFTEITSAHAAAEHAARIARERGLPVDLVVEDPPEAAAPAADQTASVVHGQTGGRLLRDSLPEVMSYFQCASS